MKLKLSEIQRVYAALKQKAQEYYQRGEYVDSWLVVREAVDVIQQFKQECYAHEAWNIPQLILPITEQIADEELSLPISPTMTIEEAAEVVRLINVWTV